MDAQLEGLSKKFNQEIAAARDSRTAGDIEIKYLGRRGELTRILRGLDRLPMERRRALGSEANALKVQLEKIIKEKIKTFSAAEFRGLGQKERVDITAPARRRVGHLHPVSIIQRELEDLFRGMGFIVAAGPELESDYYNFEALNIPPHHPARDMQDTFYIEGRDDLVLRTQTSPIQIRAMQKYGVPLRMIGPGRCFRNEATDVRHEHTFYQLEGVVISEDTSFADMKGVLEIVARHLYGQKTEVRLRPKFFPFVEPGVNGEVTCFLCRGKGCRLCKGSGWLEIFGAGMIHPNVLSVGGADPKKYQGFAFGFGLTRLVMLKYNIDDIRHFLSGDLRFIQQF
ncbi:MAG: phenylalanine--tRNA ligase subunit alpha [Patescibacteria group bacterium]|nr:phenylalanine--tRNA ligase subunit alpha [Patescibacteria group bacterium]